MLTCRLNNQKGFTLIEMLIAMAISVIVLGAAVYTYSKQDRILRDENHGAKVRDFARLIVDELEDNIRMAGYGMPPGDSTLATPRPAVAITDAKIDSITFYANTDDIKTSAASDIFLTGSGGLLIYDNTGFAINDQIVVYNVENPNEYFFSAIDSTTSDLSVVINGITYPTIDNIVFTTGFSTSPWASTLPFDVEPIQDNVNYAINKFNTITYSYNSGTKTISRTFLGSNGGTAITVPVALNVSTFEFSYYNPSGAELTIPGGASLIPGDLGLVRSVQIGLTVENSIHNNIDQILQTRVNLRNMGK